MFVGAILKNEEYSHTFFACLFVLDSSIRRTRIAILDVGESTLKRQQKQAQSTSAERRGRDRRAVVSPAKVATTPVASRLRLRRLVLVDCDRFSFTFVPVLFHSQRETPISLVRSRIFAI